MIEVTQLNGRVVVVNAEIIETVEAAPHTILTLTTSRKLMLKDTVPDLVAKVIEYRRTAHPLAAAVPDPGPGAYVRRED